MTVVLASRFDITPEAVLAVAWMGEPVAIDAAALSRIAASRAAFMRYLEEDPNASVYGVNQGQGEMVGRTLDEDDRRRLARLKPLAATVAFGEPYPHRVTRAMVLVRLYEDHGCPVSNPHTFIIEDGGMKHADYRHLAWKKRLDPLGLLNPGKSREWSRVRHMDPQAIEALQPGTAPDPA